MKTLRQIHKGKRLDIPYPRLVDKVKKLIHEYPNDIEENNGEYNINEDLIPTVIEGINRKSKFHKPDHFEWKKIKEDYIENNLTYKDVREKYNLCSKDVSKNLKGLREEHKKKLEEEEQYRKDILSDKKGIERNLDSKYMGDGDREERKWLGRKKRIRSGNYLGRDYGDRY